MASKENLGRIKHINLTTQQRRLRHLHSISARNIKPNFPLSGATLLEYLLETFFTLHVQDTSSPAIYTSEKILYSLNPTWSSFELNTLNDILQTSTSLIIVKLWGGHQSSYRLLIEWKVDLKLLQYLGDQIRTTHHPPNTLIFGLVDGYYGAPVTINPFPKTGDSVSFPSIISSIKVELDQVTPSYSKASLERLGSLQRAIRQTQISMQECQQKIEDRLLTTEKSMLQLAKRESLRLKVKLLQEELLVKVKVVNKEKEEEKRMSLTIRKRERNLAKKRKDFVEKNLLLREHKQAHVDKRESLLKLNAQLNMRRRQLACELTHIYPITTVIRGSGNVIEENYICGIRLPNSESNEFSSTDDETLSCSLGYACHLVYMISKIMEIPLRYAMYPMGSRSSIMNYALEKEKVADKEKEFPLFTKGKERIQFYYGIFLLNKNIAQLRQYYNLPTPNLRKTLPNLNDILVKKFQGSSDSLKSTSYAMNEQTSLKSQLDKKSNDSPLSKSKIDNDVLIENIKSADGTKPPLMAKPVGSISVDGDQSASISPTKPPLMPKPVGSISVDGEQNVSISPTKPPLTPKPVGSPSVDGEQNVSISPTKPPLMPKPAGSTTVDGHPDYSTSPTKPPLPPKPRSPSRNTKDKQGIINSENKLLSMVNIRYDVTSDQDTDDQRLEDLPEQTLDPSHKIRGIENNGTVSVDPPTIIPPPQGATHRFFERRSRKKSTPETAAKGQENKAEKKKKRRSLQDVRGVPVEVMRERAALRAGINEQRNQMGRQAAIAESGVQSGSTSENSVVSNEMESTIHSSSEQIRHQDNTTNINPMINSS
ncbi:UV radiation resistance-associated gene protein-like isoform X2 [Actinia tenebrosa]|uniref:UV radiation resistance-associated gene protein-like isoform X2 n=1 Tax=Actinia tenebrosa TaxID=6105 RepID=A0A6P8H4L8_ACTTE|nr:UV radiation resistance-associated gene protein-like isoform X2 [Actinia tenebrosa]